MKLYVNQVWKCKSVFHNFMAKFFHVTYHYNVMALLKEEVLAVVGEVPPLDKGVELEELVVPVVPRPLGVVHLA